MKESFLFLITLGAFDLSLLTRGWVTCRQAFKVAAYYICSHAMHGKDYTFELHKQQKTVVHTMLSTILPLQRCIVM